MFEDEYKTIDGPAEGLYKEKGSRFIALVLPVSSTDEVKDKLEQIRKKYHDARHHCYAYRLGYDKSVWRHSDGGEPSGTAGKPIFGQILSHDLTNILIIVVRYFGGIKLGTGGLIQAYKAAAADALDHATIRMNTVFDRYEILFSYEQMNEVMRVMKEERLEQTGQEFGEQCKVIFTVRKKDSNRIFDKISKMKHVSIRFLNTL
jgi:uncharacterized YigZ family protein